MLGQYSGLQGLMIAAVVVSAMTGQRAALNIAAWKPWQISLSSLATSGLDIQAIKTMYIGVGDPDTPQPDGSGLIFIDDIRVTQPAMAGVGDVTGP